MQAHRAKFNGATGNGRTSVAPLTVNNCRMKKLSDEKSIGRQSVTKRQSGGHKTLTKVKSCRHKTFTNVPSSDGFFLTGSTFCFEPIHFLAKFGSRLWRHFAAVLPSQPNNINAIGNRDGT